MSFPKGIFWARDIGLGNFSARWRTRERSSRFGGSRGKGGDQFRMDGEVHAWTGTSSRFDGLSDLSRRVVVEERLAGSLAMGLLKDVGVGSPCGGTPYSGAPK